MESFKQAACVTGAPIDQQDKAVLTLLHMCPKRHMLQPADSKQGTHWLGCVTQDDVAQDKVVLLLKKHKCAWQNKCFSGLIVCTQRHGCVTCATDVAQDKVVLLLKTLKAHLWVLESFSNSCCTHRQGCVSCATWCPP